MTFMAEKEKEKSEALGMGRCGKEGQEAFQEARIKNCPSKIGRNNLIIKV